jgi:N-acetylglucosaminyl-diphospho-decaprenol L-rhamnosyltransferase
MRDISVIIVSWNVRELLKRALQSIFDDAAAAQCTVEVVVVDNASRDGTVEMVRAEFPHVRVIANTENVGFTRANNQGLRATQYGTNAASFPASAPPTANDQYGTNAASFPASAPPTANGTPVTANGRYIFFLNPDTEIQRGALRALLDFMDAPENARVGIVGPQLFYADGSLQSSRRRFPKFSTALFESTKLEQWFPNNSPITEYRLLRTDDSAIQDVDWVVGAAMFVRRAVVEQIGGLDERFFMYSEELDWCKRAKDAGWRVVYFPNARVMHHEGKSSEQVRAQRDIYFHSSKVRYFKKHHGNLQGELLRYFLLSMFAFQWLEEGAKFLVGHKRALRAERIKAYAQVLRSGLK